MSARIHQKFTMFFRSTTHNLNGFLLSLIPQSQNRLDLTATNDPNNDPLAIGTKDIGSSNIRDSVSIGPNPVDLAIQLAKAGEAHAKKLQEPYYSSRTYKMRNRHYLERQEKQYHDPNLIRILIKKYVENVLKHFCIPEDEKLVKAKLSANLTEIRQLLEALQLREKLDDSYAIISKNIKTFSQIYLSTVFEIFEALRDSPFPKDIEESPKGSYSRQSIRNLNIYLHYKLAVASLLLHYLSNNHDVAILILDSIEESGNLLKDPYVDSRVE